MHHKRGRPRNRRAGCKMCKPWKVNGIRTERLGGERHSDHVRRTAPAENVVPQTTAELLAETNKYVGWYREAQAEALARAMRQK